jgi:hypothetical protein
MSECDTSPYRFRSDYGRPIWGVESRTFTFHGLVSFRHGIPLIRLVIASTILPTSGCCLTLSQAVLEVISHTVQQLIPPNKLTLP